MPQSVINDLAKAIESVAEKKQDSPAGENSSELSVHVPPSSPAVALMASVGVASLFGPPFHRDLFHNIAKEQEMK